MCIRDSTDNIREAVGICDYVFVAKVVSCDGTEYRNVITTEDEKGNPKAVSYTHLFKKSGTEGKCIEAREFIIALPESFVDYPPDGLLKYMTDKDVYKRQAFVCSINYGSIYLYYAW